MGKAGRKTITNPVAVEKPRIVAAPSGGGSSNSNPPSWNFSKKDLGAIIFVCSNETIDECHSKLLFGLPHVHMSYVKNIDPGLRLFLFNYSDRKMHGIYEAASHGHLSMDPYAWTGNGSNPTNYPAQVRVRVLKRYEALPESKFRKVIHKNYTDHEDRKAFFRLELDKKQTRELITMFERQPLAMTIKPPPQKRALPREEVAKLEKVAKNETTSVPFNIEPSYSSELHSHSTGNWANLFKKMPNPTPGSEAEDVVKPLDSEGDWDDEEPDSVPSSWEDEKQILKTHSNTITLENEEEQVYSKLKQLASSRENCNWVEDTKDIVPCKMDKAIVEDEEEHGYTDLLQVAFDRVYSNLVEEPTEITVPCISDNTILIEQVLRIFFFHFYQVEWLL
ncbi:hypothetical protein ACHQM5_020397 [Ranunculus cassubicifolius]